MKATIVIVVLAAATAMAGRPACRNTSKEQPLLPHADCNKYYQCANGKPITRRCPDGLNFNVRTQECDYPENVNCRRRPEETVPEESEQEEDSPEASPEENVPRRPCLASEKGLLYNHEDFCGKFLQCSGVLVEMNCPSGLNFNGETGLCDWPENVNCDKTNFYPIPAPPESAPGTNPEEGGPPTAPSCPDTDDHILLNHPDCSKFYNCEFGVPVEQSCYPGTNFNVAIGACDWPENVDCGDRHNHYKHISLNKHSEARKML